MRTAGPAILASGCTVIFALLTLGLAEVNATSGLGPIGAVGIAMAMLSMLTLLPALLAITGRGAFWRPAMFGWGNGIPHVGDAGADETHGAWRKVGERVARHPRRVWITTALVLAVCAAGVLTLEEGPHAEQRLPRRQRGGGRGPGVARRVVPERRLGARRRSSCRTGAASRRSGARWPTPTAWPRCGRPARARPACCSTPR